MTRGIHNYMPRRRHPLFSLISLLLSSSKYDINIMEVADKHPQRKNHPPNYTTQIQAGDQPLLCPTAVFIR